MKRLQIKKQLAAEFAPPKPMDKERFLSAFSVPSISTEAFMLMQLRYLRVPIVCMAVLQFFLLVLLGFDAEPKMLWLLGAFTPFLSLTILSAASLSYVHRMEELEFATRFSLKSVMLARIGCFGILNGLLLLTMTAVLGRRGIHILTAGTAILLPYMTTVSIALPLVRKYHGRIVGFLCTFVSGLVSAGTVYIQVNALTFSGLGIAIVFILELFVIVSECAKFMYRTEELTWNYI